MFADLHLHSRSSDGTYAPEDFGNLALRFNLAAVALTDHDTVEGCAAAAAACETAGVGFLPGLELTAEWQGQEVHLLAYYVDIGHAPLLTQLARFQVARQDRIREMVGRLNRLGIPLLANAVFELARCRSPGRPHVAQALVHAGHCQTLDEAFERFLRQHRPAWVPKYKVPAAEAIALLHRAGALAVMAHPGLYPSDAAIPELVEAG